MKVMGAQPAVIVRIRTTSEGAGGRVAALFDAHEERLYRLARRLTSSADEARDLVQETFLRAAASPASVPVGHGREEGWLVRVLVNIRRDQWRRAAVRTRSVPTLRASVVDKCSTQESALIAKEAVWSALDVLAPRRRAIVIMYELDGTSLAAIAALLGVSTMTVRWHLSMGRRDLKRILTAHFGDLT